MVKLNKHMCAKENEMSPCLSDVVFGQSFSLEIDLTPSTFLDRISVLHFLNYFFRDQNPKWIVFAQDLQMYNSLPHQYVMCSKQEWN